MQLNKIIYQVRVSRVGHSSTLDTYMSQLCGPTYTKLFDSLRRQYGASRAEQEAGYRLLVLECCWWGYPVFRCLALFKKSCADSLVFFERCGNNGFCFIASRAEAIVSRETSAHVPPEHKTFPSADRKAL
jgi:hypothetical protein